MSRLNSDDVRRVERLAHPHRRAPKSPSSMHATGWAVPFHKEDGSMLKKSVGLIAALAFLGFALPTPVDA